MTAVIIGVCGGLGALTRFLVDTGVRRFWPVRFPVATMAINFSGSAVLGFVLAGVENGAPGAVEAAVGTGFCGGYTTFSTAMVETVALIRERRMAAGSATLLGQAGICVLAAAGGYAVGA